MAQVKIFRPDDAPVATAHQAAPFKDRRRSGRIQDVSPALIPLLRNQCTHDVSAAGQMPVLAAESRRTGVIVRYIPPFEAVRALFMPSQSPHGEAVSENLMGALRLLLAGIEVDEEWYLAQNPDIAQAIAAGTTGSPKQHFVDHGYFEGRLPFPITVDEQWYLSQNQDVCENVCKGTVTSAQRHFDTDGYREGRLPFALDDSGSRRKAGPTPRLAA